MATYIVTCPVCNKPSNLDINWLDPTKWKSKDKHIGLMNKTFWCRSNQCKVLLTAEIKFLPENKLEIIKVNKTKLSHPDISI